MMKYALVAGLLCVGSTASEAKVLLVPKTGKNVDQLHDELLARFPEWQGAPTPSGGFADPLLEVESTDTTIRLTVPDDADETAINAVLSAHTPKPPKNLKAIVASAKAKLKAQGFTEDEISVLVRF